MGGIIYHHYKISHYQNSKQYHKIRYEQTLEIQNSKALDLMKKSNLMTFMAERISIYKNEQLKVCHSTYTGEVYIFVYLKGARLKDESGSILYELKKNDITYLMRDEIAAKKQFDLSEKADYERRQQMRAASNESLRQLRQKDHEEYLRRKERRNIKEHGLIIGSLKNLFSFDDNK